MMWLYMVALLGFFFLFRWFREQLTVPNLPDKYVLITGCGSGFGNLLARQLDQRGLLVLAACHNENSAKLLKESTSQRLQTIVVEVTESDSVDKMAQWVKQQVGSKGLWGLVNNAGMTFPTAPNEWLCKQDFQKILDVNLLGAIDVTLRLAPLVRKARGRIVNMSAVAGRLSLVGGGYSISKFGLEAFSDSLRRELSPFGVKVILIEPGFFLTGLSDYNTIYGSFVYGFQRSSPQIQKSYGKAYLTRFEKNIRNLKENTNLSLVTANMQHGLTAKYPRTRYTVGWDAKLLYLPLSYCPTAFVDFYLTRTYPQPAQQA